MSHYLITGSSSGIGAALATQLTANGHAVSGVARRKQRLTALANQLNSFNGYAADVGDTESLAYAIRKAKAKSGAIDVAILNAGIYQPQDGTKIDPQIYANHMTINYLGVVNALAGLVPDMVRDGKGHIAIVSSVAGVARIAQISCVWPDQGGIDITC